MCFVTVEIICSKFFHFKTGLDDNETIFAVGDIHGYAENFSPLVQYFNQNSQHWKKKSIVLLGDLIDRGPNNLECIDIAIGLKNTFDETHFLQGNHEALLRIAYTENQPKLQKLWLKHGGKTTLDEIGIHKLNFSTPETFRTSFKSALGAKRVKFLDGLKSHCQYGNLIFTHAGTDPNNSLKAHFAQLWNDKNDTHWCWIRDKFINHPSPFTEYCVVHGHTPFQKKPYKPNDDIFTNHKALYGKMNLDGGSYASGCVTSAQFTSSGYQIICAINYR